MNFKDAFGQLIYWTGAIVVILIAISLAGVALQLLFTLASSLVGSIILVILGIKVFKYWTENQ